MEIGRLRGWIAHRGCAASPARRRLCARLCVGVNGNGDLLVSNDPAHSWTTSSVKHHDFTDPEYGYSVALAGTSVACPSASLCVAIDALGNVIVGKRTPAS